MFLIFRLFGCCGKAVPHNTQKENCAETPEKEMPSQRASSNSCNTSNEMSTYIGSNKSSRWLMKRLDKAKESLRLSREDDDRAYKARYAKLVAKRAALKENAPSASAARRIERICQQLKWAKPENSAKTVGLVDDLQLLKKNVRKLRQLAKGDNEVALAWSRKAEEINAEVVETDAEVVVETDAEVVVETEADTVPDDPFAQKRKKKKPRVLLPEDE